MAYKVYRSSDAGAPVASIPANDSAANLKAKLIQILDACLVNGYGTKTSAGWSKPYANDGTYAMYKSAQGHCFRVEEGFTTSYYNGVRITAYETDPGSLGFGARTDLTRPYIFTTSSYSGGVSEDFYIGTAEWVVYASPNSFAIFLSENINTGSARSYLFWCGKITNEETNEIGVGQIGGGIDNSTYPALSRWKSLDTFSHHQFKTPSIDSFRNANLLFGSLSSTNYPGNPATSGSNPLSEGKFRYAPVKILDRNNGFYKGILDGVITLEHACPTFLNLNDTITINNKQYIVCMFLPQAQGEEFESFTNATKGFVLFEYANG